MRAMTHPQPSFAFVLAGLSVYLLPSFIAMGRRTPHFATGFLINLFFGWTVIGWMYSMAWAAFSDPKGQAQGELQLLPIAQRVQRTPQPINRRNLRRAA